MKKLPSTFGGAMKSLVGLGSAALTICKMGKIAKMNKGSACVNKIEAIFYA